MKRNTVATRYKFIIYSYLYDRATKERVGNLRKFRVRPTTSILKVLHYLAHVNKEDFNSYKDVTFYRGSNGNPMLKSCHLHNGSYGMNKDNPDFTFRKVGGVGSDYLYTLAFKK